LKAAAWAINALQVLWMAGARPAMTAKGLQCPLEKT
jgi:hypothetical protein